MVGVGVEEMRSCLLEALRRMPNTQEPLLRSLVAEVAIERSLIARTHEVGYQTLDEDSWRVFRDVLWALIAEGVLAIGANVSNPSWPFLSVTGYGSECLAKDRIVPHDPAGYIRDLERIRPLDDVERRFVSQALEAFLRNLPDASAVMLGCASEHLVQVLAQALVASNPTGEVKTQNLLSHGKAKTLLDHVNSRLGALARAKKLPWQLEEMRETYYNAIAQLIRVSRNDAGHPARQRPVDRDTCFVLLQLFRTYRTWVTEVMQNL